MKAVIKTLEDLEEFSQKAARSGVLTGQAMTVMLTKFRRPRTLEQNAKLHILFRELGDHCGYAEGEVKDFFKAQYGPAKILAIGGMRTVPKGTSEYSIDELNEMIERVYQVGAEAGCEFQECP